MTKPTITKTWLAGLIMFVVGLLVSGIGVSLMLAFAGHFTPAASGNGSDFTPTIDGFFWMTVSLMVLGSIVAAVGGIVQLAAWIGALVNTYQIVDKTWFAVLLASGLLGLAFGLVGFAGMVAYVVAGPDGTAIRAPQLAVPSLQVPPLARAS